MNEIITNRTTEANALTSNANGVVITGTLAVTGATEIDGDLTVDSSIMAKGSLRGDAPNILYSNGWADGTTDVVIRKDANFAFIFPWGTGTATNSVAIGGGSNAGQHTNLAVTGDTTLWGNLQVGSSPASKAKIFIGTWAISTDENNNLCFTNSGDGAILVNNRRVLCDQDPCYISNDQGTLNGTKHLEIHARGWEATTYWMSNPDGDSNLKISYGTV